MMVNGGTLFVRTLRRADIDTLFCLHGGHLDPIFQAARDEDMRLIDTRHEQAAGHAADGWARTTGRPGVAIVTAGPGMTDCVTAIANAHLDCVPTLFVAGAAPLREAETLPLQGGLDQVAMVEPITKWAHRVTHTERIPDLVAQALRIATSGRPGPVFLELPIDVLFAEVDEARAPLPEKIFPDSRPAPAPEADPAGDRVAARSRAPRDHGGWRRLLLRRRGRPAPLCRAHGTPGLQQRQGARACCLPITRSADAASSTWPSPAPPGRAPPMSCSCWAPVWVCSRAGAARA